MNFANAKFGSRGAIVGEPLAWVEEYPIQWREPRLYLAELARLRWIEGFSHTQLAEYFSKSENAIQCRLQHLRRIGYRLPDLTDQERKTIVSAQTTRRFVMGKSY